MIPPAVILSAAKNLNPVEPLKFIWGVILRIVNLYIVFFPFHFSLLPFPLYCSTVLLLKSSNSPFTSSFEIPCSGFIYEFILSAVEGIFDILFPLFPCHFSLLILPFHSSCHFDRSPP